ncbi:DUF89-domain-containing protein [Tilletiaria anomala UBC 951]|uniref:DUF89-domain-containing protein n=1 Tax=Tilletiaria anomala (strain ATCC 24038 / CBS 436.72 / UBC 951) TaxID=1037660 RepID=A0A066WAY8_TILAU|nr:DUF89-domain-containing protein [Tilletiaria anomala UBC 951]KDN50871.1 DUF89-domain-containing protein [Tilletiaria anomala UBC 951]
MAAPPTSDPKLWIPPVTLSSAVDHSSFAYESTVSRWPQILTSNVIQNLEQASYALSFSSKDQSEKIKEADEIIDKAHKFLQEIKDDRQIQPIQGGPQADGAPSSEAYDSLIEANKWTWHKAPWLFAECYLYRRVRGFFSGSTHWKTYDPFSHSKLSTFKSSGTAIRALAENVNALVAKAQSSGGVTSSKEALYVLWLEMAQISLWGNATDLSLLTSLSYDDIQALQTTGRKQQEARAKFILANDLERVYSHISSLESGRVDIVLDNSGFELVTDLVFADWLVSCTPFVQQVVFHPKDMPWFVSDVTPPDFRFTLDALLTDSFFTSEDDTKTKAGEAHGTAANARPGSSIRHRSTSRTREVQANPAIFAEGKPLAPPAGSRSLQYNPNNCAGAREGMADGQQRHGTLEHPAGSSQLRMANESSQGGALPHPKGSMALQLDPAYFKNARSRTISPSRSYVIDSSAFASFSLEGDGPARAKSRERRPGQLGGDDDCDKGDRMGRSHSVRDINAAKSNASTSDSPSRGRSSSTQRGRSGFRSFGADDANAIPEDAEVPSSGAAPTPVQQMVQRWRAHLASGAFKLSVPVETSLEDSSKEVVQHASGFWTMPFSFADLPAKDPELLKELQKSDLVIFKGDLNYRKLTSDGNWPTTTTFEAALGPLAGKLNILALRTCKADVCVGLREGLQQEMDAKDARWRVNGKWAVVQFSKRSSA